MESLIVDSDDDHVLACAVAAGADFIVSGDSDLLDLKAYQGIPVVTVRRASQAGWDAGELRAATNQMCGVPHIHPGEVSTSFLRQSPIGRNA